MRIATIAFASLLAMPSPAHAQAALPTRGVPVPPVRLSWVSCRVIAPSTLQLIWSSVPGGLRFQVELTSAAGPSIAMDTTADSTFTRASLPAGSFRIVVKPIARVGTALNASAAVPVRGSARCAGT